MSLVQILEIARDRAFKLRRYKDYHDYIEALRKERIRIMKGDNNE